jgi:cobalamin biosynthetic protein CobC
LKSLHRVAQRAYATDASIVATGGAQTVIQLLPHLTSRERARILAPTYGEYAGVLSAAGWDVIEVPDLEALEGADLAVVANPNNPDGRRHDPNALLALLPRVGRLVIDESFADAVPDVSIAAEAKRPGLLVLRSFGKFWGLAGLRLGFALGSVAEIAAIAAMAGPWPVSGAAIEIGRRALLDDSWAKRTAIRLARDAVRLDTEVQLHGWKLVGGTPLFRLYENDNALSAQARLARGWIWSRVFKHRPRWLRLGLPGKEVEWERLARVLAR